MQLKRSPKIWKLAKDLRIRRSDDVVQDILLFCQKKIKKFLRDFHDCSNLSELLLFVAQKVGTSFEEIHSEDDLERIKSKYLNRGEKIFVRLREELSGEVFGVTYRLTNREPWEQEFVSIIDCRGQKLPRSYYTKWHEIGHLLILTDQMRLSFQRTNLHGIELKDPEEVLVDVIAGTFGFYSPLIQKHARGTISFEEIENLRELLCPEASKLSSLIGFVKAWPSPCLLVQGMLSFKRKDQALLLNQPAFDFYDKPALELRAVHVTINTEARMIGLNIFENMRIPKKSIIYRAFSEKSDCIEAHENLSWWETSDGTRLTECSVLVMARCFPDSVYALIIPNLDLV